MTRIRILPLFFDGSKTSSTHNPRITLIMKAIEPTILSLLYYSVVSSAWAPTFQSANHRSKFSSRLRSSQVEDVLGGVSTFENWFRSVPGSECIDSIFHDDFGNLRGLAYLTKSEEREEEKNVMKIPKSIVLESDFSQQDWDAQLSQKLWAECKKGSSSSISGYVELLTKGWTPSSDLTSIPPNTAPDALRHWTSEQLQILSENPSGQKLLNLMQQQEEIWKRKYSNVASDMTYEQFQWAMEVVHSRAFCGEFGIKGGVSSVLFMSPLISGLLGYIYYVQLHGQNDLILAGLALIAGIPVIASLLFKDSPVAVLLPLIDSANHLEEADSSIDYSPLDESFGLTIGRNCVVQENGKNQLFISYGRKKDTELLLNYGFLGDVDLSDGDADSRRRKLAETFLSRQN